MIKRSLSLLLLLLFAVSMAQTTDGARSGVGSANIAKLRKLKMRFALPTYVPAGYKFKAMKIEEPNDPVMLTLTIEYRNAKTKSDLIVQMCSDGIGDVFFTLPGGDTVEPTGEMKWKSSILGSGIIETYVKGKYREWHLNWIELKQKPIFLSVIGHNMSASEGKRVIEGLRWLK
jgi:hypothetical protein